MSDSTSLAPVGTDVREIEWQLATDDLAAVRLRLDRHPTLAGMQVLALPPQQLRDTYWDTTDWRVWRAGFALRVRERSDGTEGTLKSLRSARADRAARREITESLEHGIASLANARGPVGTLVREAAGTAVLQVLFVVETRRQRYGVRQPGDSADAGEIALDESEFHAAGGAHLRRLLRVEVEAFGPPLEPLERLVEVLSRQCGLTPARLNKFAVGLAAGGWSPPG